VTSLRKKLPLFFVFLLVVSFTKAPANAEPGPNLSEESPNSLHFVHWDGSVFSWNREGVCSWVMDDQGNLRLEVLLTGVGDFQTNLQQLMEWSGTRGWTVISSGDGGGTFSRWYEQWQELDPALDSWLRTFVSVFPLDEVGSDLPADVREITPGGRSLTMPMFSVGLRESRLRRFQITDFYRQPRVGNSDGKNFRARLTRRGTGRGGSQTVLNVMGTLSGPTGLLVTSSRSPGVLVLDRYCALPASFDPEAVFLPWWPLSDVITLEN
jgi:hypothetical protein